MVTAYLSAKGWQVKEQQADQWSFSRSVDGAPNPVEVQFATRPGAEKFPEQMETLIEHLARIEQRPRSQVLTDLTYTAEDIIRITVRRPETAHATVGVDNGLRLVQGLQKMVTAIAWATLEPGPYLAGRKPRQVAEYMRTVRLGQTEAEGFTAMLLSPLGSLDGDPLARRVVETLAGSLGALQSAMNSPSALRDADERRSLINRGISANLCDALVRLFGKPPRRTVKRKIAVTNQIDFRFTWSPLLSVPQGTPTCITFEAEVISTLQDLSSVFRETMPQEGFQIEGIVTDLKRRDREGLGKVSISNTTGEEPEKVVFELEDEPYGRAIEAHRTGKPVQCTGTLVKHNRSYELLDPALALPDAE